MKMEIKASTLLDVIKASSATNRDEIVMRFKDDRWISKIVGPAEVLMAAARVPETIMKSYDRGEHDALAIETRKIKDFINSSGDIITLELNDRTLHIRDDNTHARLATLDPDSVESEMPSAPNLSYEVTVNNSPDMIFNFISRQDEVIGASSIVVDCDEDGIFLYSDGDNGHMDKFISSEDLGGYGYDWDVGNESASGGYSPATDERISVILGTQFTSSINAVADNCTILLGNQSPMKMVFKEETEDGNEGLSISYIQAPRLDEDGSSVVPESIIKSHK